MENFKVFLEFVKSSSREQKEYGLELGKTYEGEEAYRLIENLMEFERNLLEHATSSDYSKTFLDFEIGDIHEKNYRVNFGSGGFADGKKVSDAMEELMIKNLRFSLEKESIEFSADLAGMDEKTYRSITEKKIAFIQTEMKKFRKEESLFLKEREKKEVCIGKEEKKKKKGGIGMTSIRKIVEEKLKKGKENGFKGLETKMSLEDMRKETGLGEVEFKEALTKALKNNEIFLVQPKEEKIAYDGSFKEVDKGNPKWMVSKEHFQSLKNREEEFQKQHNERRKEGRETSYQTKKQVVSSLSPNAQKAFEAIHEMTEGKAYVLANDVCKRTDLPFPKWKEALEELKKEKVSFLIPIGKKEDGQFKENWVVTNSKALKDKVVERENLKKEMGIIPKFEKAKEETKEESIPSKKKGKVGSKEKKVPKIPKKKKEKEEAIR